MHTHMHTYIYTHMNACSCIHIRLSVCVFMCVCVRARFIYLVSNRYCVIRHRVILNPFNSNTILIIYFILIC